MRVACAVVLSLLSASAVACGGGGDAEVTPLVAQGRKVYLSVCIACHNPDPNLEGAAGPAVAGSPRELVEAKVMRGEYPPGYEPKRATRAMPPQPHLAEHIDALAAFLAASARP